MLRPKLDHLVVLLYIHLIPLGLDTLCSALDPIPMDKPTINDLPNQVIFRRIGSVSPVLNFVHLRTTVHLDALDGIVDQLCEFPVIMDKLAHFDRRTGTHDKTPYVLKGPVPGTNRTQTRTQQLETHFGIAHGIKEQMLQSFSSWETSPEKTRFLITMNRKIQETESLCHRAQASVSLLNRLLAHNPESFLHKHQILRRFAGAAIGFVITAIGGLFMESQIQSLSSSQSNIATKQQHIIESLSDLQEVTKIIDDNTNQLFIMFS